MQIQVPPRQFRGCNYFTFHCNFQITMARMYINLYCNVCRAMRTKQIVKSTTQLTSFTMRSKARQHPEAIQPIVYEYQLDVMQPKTQCRTLNVSTASLTRRDKAKGNLLLKIAFNNLYCTT